MSDNNEKKILKIRKVILKNELKIFSKLIKSYPSFVSTLTNYQIELENRYELERNNNIDLRFQKLFQNQIEENLKFLTYTKENSYLFYQQRINEITLELNIINDLIDS